MPNSIDEQKPIINQPQSYQSLENYQNQQAVIPVKAHATVEISCNNCCNWSFGGK